MEYETMARLLREADGARVWVTFETDEDETVVGWVVDVSATDNGRARVRDFPHGEMWSIPVPRLVVTLPPPAAALGEPLTIETMTVALAHGRHPWVVWEERGVTRRGTVDGFVPDEDGVVQVRIGERTSSAATQRVMVGRLSLELRDSTPSGVAPSDIRSGEYSPADVEARLTRERDEARHERDTARAQLNGARLELRALRVITPDPANGREITRPSDALPFIRAQTAPVNARGEKWVAADRYNTAMRERDDAVADATRTRRLLWTVLRGVAVSEAQAAAWLSLLLEEPPTG